MEMYLDGYLRGAGGGEKSFPTYEIESYELGYKHGVEGKIEHYFEVSECTVAIERMIPPTRKKNGT